MESQREKREQETRYKNIEDVFEKLIKVEFPDSPENLPNEIHLPPEAYDGFIDAILAQETDDVTTGPRERSQFVGLLRGDGKLTNTPVIPGTPSQTSDGFQEIATWFRPLLGHFSKPFTYWHTHTEKYRSHLSTSDAAQRIGEDRKALIYLLGAPDGITAVLQTRKAQPQRIPLSTAKKGFAAYDELLQFYDSDLESPDLIGLAHYFEKHGYVLYTWKKEKPEDSVKAAHERGVFRNGIPLHRINQHSS